MNGAELIAKERQRQIDVEGWTAEHDAAYEHGELAAAATAYAGYAASQLAGDLLESRRKHPPFFWPWDGKWWKPKSSILRNLVRAGALIAAEIDRLLAVGYGSSD